LGPVRRFFIRYLRVAVLALRGFRAHRCGLRASALTFYTLLSLVPVVAMAFGIAKGFGFEAVVEREVRAQLRRQPPEIADGIIDFAKNLLANTRGGLIAGIGLIVLLWTVIRVLSNIEHAFNHIWGVHRARSLGKRFTDYFSLMLVCPILMIVAGSATVYIKAHLQSPVEAPPAQQAPAAEPEGTAPAAPPAEAEGPSAGPAAERAAAPGGKEQTEGADGPQRKPNALLLAAVRAMPLVFIWLMFAFLYLFMPNTKVKLWSGLLAGIVAGTIYQVVQMAYITFQVGVARYNAIYGSFAALPLFLIWIQISWLVVLLGAELSFAHQNVHTYEFEEDVRRVSPSFRRLLALRVMHLLVRNFERGEPPATPSDICERLELPVRLVNEVLFDLAQAGLVSEVADATVQESGYQPARDPEAITVKFVLDALDRRGSDAIPVAESPELERLRACLAEFDAALERSPANRPLKNL